MVLICILGTMLSKRHKERASAASFLGGHFCVRCCYCHHPSPLLMHTPRSTLKVETSAPRPSMLGARVFKACTSWCAPPFKDERVGRSVCVCAQGCRRRVDTRCLGPPHTFSSVQFPPPYATFIQHRPTIILISLNETHTHKVHVV